MNTKPSINENETPQEIVQDYLNLILSSACARQEPQVSELTKRINQPAVKFSSISLNMASGTTVSPASKTRRQRHGDTSIKPFADPVKPLTLAIPLAEVEPETVIEQHAPDKQNSRQAIASARESLVRASQIRVQHAVEPEPSPILESDTSVLPPSEDTVTTQWLENGRPGWAQGRFECLLFRVGGLTLAAPLVELGTIYPLEHELTHLFGQADWFLGLLSIKGLHIRTANTIKLVMPERYKDTRGEVFSYVITINGVDWGLAVDSISSAITLEPGDVKWRGDRDKHPWFAGTVIGKMCLLLDVSQLAALFLRHDKHSR